MFTINKRLLIMPIAVLLLSFCGAAFAQFGNYFGQNKVQYKDFDWSVLKTEHFEVYYYPEEARAARDAARMAERGYAYLSEVLEYQVKEPIPLILYASLNDFQQTNVVSGIMDQSTRGVTEGLKNRVIIPLTGSYREFNHVLVHEMVHAFQFDMIFNSKFSNRRFNPPLWFVEGLAEYLSVGMDDVTRMWVRDGLLHDNLLTLKQLNGAYDIRVYRLGESLWHYIGISYGKKMAGKLFKAAIRSGDTDAAIKEMLELKPEELSERWHTYEKNLVLPSDSTLKTPAQIAEKLTHRAGYYHRMNLVPAVSPDGSQIAYIANKDLKEDIYLLTRRQDGNYDERQLLSGGDSRRFETLRYMESSIGWSRNGQRIAFVSKSGQNDVLYVMNPNNGEILKKFMFDKINSMQSPSFSPDGSRLVFSGIRGGISDLYIVEISSGKLIRLTDDRFAIFHPQWSPDGKTIVFATDRGWGSEESNLLFGDYDLALFHLQDNRIEMITRLAGNAVSPQWSPDGKEVAFISNLDGIYNIYRMNLATREITPITRLKNGVLGITETTPAISWSCDGSTLVFSSFYDQGWHLYRMDPEPSPVTQRVSEPAPTLAEAVPADSGLRLPDMPDPNEFYRSYPLEENDSLEMADYSPKFKLDYIAVGGGYNNYYGGIGQAQMLFSDMMGDHNFYFATQTQFSDFLHSDFGLTYLNLANRLHYGLQLFQTNALYAMGAGYNFVDYLRFTYRGFNGLTSYPFSRYSRMEFFGGLTWVDADLVSEVYNFSNFNRETQNLNWYKYAQFGTALVFDNTVYGPMGPLNGSRSRFSVETATLDFQFTNFFADYRRYHNFGHRSVLAWRLMGGASTGKDPQIFSIGGPYTYRGADYGELFGTKFLVSNLEYRFPLFPFLSPKFDFLNLATFYDMAAAWGVEVPGYASKAFQPFSGAGGFHLNDLQSAAGLGIRFNIGYFLLQYDYAWPTDLRSFDKPVKKFSIGTYF